MRSKRPFVWIVCSFTAGIFWHALLTQRMFEICLITAVFLFVAFYFRRNKSVFTILIVIIFFQLGWLCEHSRWVFAQDHIYFLKGKIDFTQIVLRGIIDSDIRKSEGGYTTRLSFVLNVREVLVEEDWQNVSGKVLVNIFRNDPLSFGDDIVLRGNLHAPFEFSHDPRFSYRAYLKRKGIYYVLSVKKNSEIEVLRKDCTSVVLRALHHWRLGASRKLSRHLPPEQAAVMQAILLGERARIPEHLKDLFTRTGTRHILAISGLHVGIVVMVVFLLLRVLPGPAGIPYVLTMIFIGLYVCVTGASASVARAGVMSAVFLLSFVLERETESFNSLAFAAFLLLIANPQNIYDVGFQLSFTSVLAILLFYPRLMRILKPLIKKNSASFIKWMIESCVVSLSASLGVTGWIIYYFHILTPASLLANLFVVPLSSLALVLGMGLLIFPVAVTYFALCLQAVLSLMVWLMLGCAHFPFSYYYLQDVNAWYIVSYYLMLAFFILCLDDIDRSGAD